MPVSILPSFLLYCYITAITPGPANLCSLSTALRYGRTVALRQWRGLATGFFIDSMAAVLISRLLGDVLGTEADAVSRPLEDDVDLRLLREALGRLPDKEKAIVSLRYGIGGGREKTQKEVADLMGISQSYISRLEKRIILRLRREILKQIC